MLRVLAIAGALLAAHLASPASAQDRPVVVPVNYPLAYFAARLGGDAVDVRYPVLESADPAFWEPSLSEIGGIQEADVIALNGAGFAQWTTRVSLPRSATVDTTRGLEDRYIRTDAITHSHGDGDEHSHDAIASHTWLDFAIAADQTDALAVFMQRRMRNIADRIAQNRAALRDDLMALDARAQSVAAGLENTTILATHPVYQYFARAYGLTIESLGWEAGAMPSAEQWDALAALQAETGAETLVWEAAPRDEALARAEDMGLRSVVFPPLAAPPREGDFLSVMSDVLDALEAQ
ncbi:metal ABC transporter substrate-binding protein [Citreimonas salinaria]|uniref:High-affinity zinc uptake system protein ZnuA n=1 Tax=Citreimonas salinaria TaxID=321339 RepID=A0A1H3EWY8_9RHOB|nr:metal ABC transporter substrate-binding protein [Citreimonas salinaria]SDX83333.1 zinc transport system substrate-binding protein [Citreimonas salinaria]